MSRHQKGESLAHRHSRHTAALPGGLGDDECQTPVVPSHSSSPPCSPLRWFVGRSRGHKRLRSPSPRRNRGLHGKRGQATSLTRRWTSILPRRRGGEGLVVVVCVLCALERGQEGAASGLLPAQGLCAVKQIQKKCAHSYFLCVLSVFWSNARARPPEKGCPHFSWVVFRKLSDNCARFELNTVRRPTWSMAFYVSC